MNKTEWSEALQRAARELSEKRWAVCDLIVSGMDRFSLTYGEVSEIAGLAEETVRLYARTCRTFPPNKRWPELSMEHHRWIGQLPASERQELGDRCIRERIGTLRLAKIVIDRNSEIAEEKKARRLSSRRRHKADAPCFSPEKVPMRISSIAYDCLCRLTQAYNERTGENVSPEAYLQSMLIRAARMDQNGFLQGGHLARMDRAAG